MIILGILTPLILFVFFLVVIALIKKTRAPTPDITTTTVAKKAGFNWIGWVVVILVALGIYGCYRSSKTQTQSRSAQRQATVSQQWQLCWEKKPKHIGKTNTRQLCLPARIETRTASYLVISYIYSGGRGVMEGTSINGIEYDGQWKDSTGQGRWHLKFVSSDTAFGWSDDEGKGEKGPNVLIRVKGGLAHASGPPLFFTFHSILPPETCQEIHYAENRNRYEQADDSPNYMPPAGASFFFARCPGNKFYHSVKKE